MLERNTSCLRAPLRDKRAESAHALEKHSDIAAQADHAESFADPVGSRFRCGRKKTGRDSVAIADSYDVVHRLQHPRMIKLCRNAHRDCEVVMAYPSHIHSR